MGFGSCDATLLVIKKPHTDHSSADPCWLSPDGPQRVCIVILERGWGGERENGLA